MQDNIYFDDEDRLEEVIVNRKQIRKIERSESASFLTKTIKSHYNHILSQTALENPNCTPEILEEVLKRDVVDEMSYRAVKHKNCPVELLVETYTHKDQWLKCGVLLNPNCPLYILIEVLNKFEDNAMSRSALTNYKVPKYLKEEWHNKTKPKEVVLEDFLKV